MKPDKYWWIQNKPTNETAYNNQCVKCGYDKNPRHGMRFVDGRHTYKNDTPIYCERCGALLPRPTMVDKLTGERRRIKGFDSAYRRMSWDAPAPTLTQNLQVETSDKKYIRVRIVLYPYMRGCAYRRSVTMSINLPYIRWKLVGNAVTVDVIAWIANKILAPEQYDFSQDIELAKGHKWPNACWGFDGKRFASSSSLYPIDRVPFIFEENTDHIKLQLTAVIKQLFAI